MASPETEIAKAVAENGPFTLQNLWPTILMAGVAMLGGYVNFRQKMKAGKVRGWNFAELIGEMVVSAFVGILTFWVCRGFEVNEYLTAAAVAITGHLGARAIFMVEQAVEKKVEGWGIK
jgi:cytochrome bd-type quinol oxidase subunit 2